ncbi:Transposon Ty1-NL2 Gag-Pol polyprotein [Rhynchospora pubera]|uniref:Transposon Ty1-NL2 Gag-Pol polyprotein n=1 Tax=Rhynchospora pubera TaxID=906938 RepID=A0AAV8BPM3_9POAL|nr:Transposon Ty1-NL2 Gag-Pol polyprotein [Rhynchospora pubera]
MIQIGLVIGVKFVNRTKNHRNMSSSSFTLRSLVEREKLAFNGANFLDWHRNLRLAFRYEKREYLLTTPMPSALKATASQEEKDAFAKHENEDMEMSVVMVATMEAELQKEFMDSGYGVFAMITRLSNMFQTKARTERARLIKAVANTRLAEGHDVGPHVMKMAGLFRQLEKLDTPFPSGAIQDFILNSLPPSFTGFVVNYRMNGMDKSMDDIQNMLIETEESLKKEKGPKDVLAVSGKSKKIRKRGRKGKGKGPVTPQGPAKGAPVGSKKKKNPASSETVCYYCSNKGHWKRNCPRYLADKKAGTVQPSTSGIFVIETLLATSHTDWVFDTGSCAHICRNVQVLRNRRRLEKGEVQLRVGNGTCVSAMAVGSVELTLPNGFVLELKDVFVVPCITRNIVSVSCLDLDGYDVVIKNKCLTLFRNEVRFCDAHLLNGLYVLDSNGFVLSVENDKRKRKVSHENATLMWHCRLGHINEKRIKRLQSVGLLDQFAFEPIDTCESCLMGKMTKAPFPNKGIRANGLLDLIHTDVCGPMSICARGGFSYFVTFTDDYSRYGYIYLMRHKSETFDKFKEFKSEVENQLDRKIKALRSDRGGEYLSHEFGDYLKECGIIPQLTPPGTPQWNGVSERRNRTLLDMVRSMMSQTNLPMSFWGYAIETAAFTLNRVPSKSVEKTPYELWFGSKPSMMFLKIWGCEAYVKRLVSDKLGPKSDKCHFVGYPKETKGYYFYNRVENKIVVARHAEFLEKEFISRRSSGSNVVIEEIQEPQQQNIPQVGNVVVPNIVPNEVAPNEIVIEPIPQVVVEEEVQEQAPSNEYSNISRVDSVEDAPILEVQEQSPQTVVEQVQEPQASTLRRSARPSRPPIRYLGLHDVLVMENDEPLTIDDMKRKPDSKEWLKAMESEMQSMYDNKVWTLVDLPNGVKPVENKWIFKRKVDMDGNLTIYKARLVAKGYKQVHGIDYEETFSPVVMFKSIRIMLAIAAFYDYEIWQMDVKTAFLNGNLEEDVYMTQPECFVDPKNANKVCKLQRSIYGLKQASRSWNKRFDEEVKKLNFVQSEKEPCVYKRISGSVVVFLVLYVDDILLIGNDIPELNAVKDSLKKVFSMKDLGEAAYILGIKIYRDRSRRMLGLSQDAYIDKVLNKHNMANSKKGFLPMSHGIFLSKSQSPTNDTDREYMKKFQYPSVVGSIMYAMLCTRPDVAHPISVTSRFQANPGMAHWTAVKNILKYLKRTKDSILVYGGDQELVVSGYTDASFQTDRDDSKSQSGFVFLLNGGAVSWKSSKQDTTADSVTEAEYLAAGEAAKEGVWIKEFLTELEVVPSISGPVDIYCDNTGAIAQSKEPRSHQKTRHILRRFHLIRQLINDGWVKVKKVDGAANTADPLTKPLSRAAHELHVASMGIRRMPEWL